MPATLHYDDENLQRLFEELKPRRRMAALKGAFRRAANRVRKTAVNNLRSSIRTDKDLEKGIRAEVLKRKTGFRVTIGSKVMKGRYKGTRKGRRLYGRAKSTWSNFSYHTNRQGKEKPVLIWAEAGTKWRKTKKPTRFIVGGRWRTGRNRGMMRRYGFMQKTAEEVRGGVTASLHNEVINSVKRVAEKYGCN